MFNIHYKSYQFIYTHTHTHIRKERIEESVYTSKFINKNIQSEEYGKEKLNKDN